MLTFLCGSTSRTVQALSLQSSVFHGSSLVTSSPSYSVSSSSSEITMRKQKASDRRTRRAQRGEIEDERMEAVGSLSTKTLTTSPMSAAGPWNLKQSSSSASTMQMQRPPLMKQQLQATGAGEKSAPFVNQSTRDSDSASTSGSSKTARTPGRGRSRKRSTLYSSLAFYHNKFLILLTDEYQAEVRFNT
jgi:hypothetical protein